MLNLVDEYVRECFGDPRGTQATGGDVIEVLVDAMIEHGVPEYIRLDNDHEFVAKELRRWLANRGAGTPYVAPESPLEN